MSDPLWNSVRAIQEFNSSQEIDRNLPPFPDGPLESDPYSTNTKFLMLCNEENSSTADPYFSQVSLLLHLIGPEGGQTFSDTSDNNKAVAVFGQTKSTQASYVFNNCSVYFDGAGDYLRIPYYSALDLSSGDFTLECWFNADGFSTYQHLFAKDTYGSNFDWNIAIPNSTTIAIHTYQTYSSLVATVPEMSPGVWYHVAISRSSGVNRIFLNGVMYASNSMAISNDSQLYITIGCGSHNNPNGFFKGYLSEVRITKGTGRYSSNFSVPTATFPDKSPRALESTGKLLSTAGMTLADKKIPKLFINKTLYWLNNGSGAGFYASDSEDWNFESGDFTLELWVWRPGSLPSTFQALISQRTSASSNHSFTLGVEPDGYLSFEVSSTGGAGTKIISKSPIKRITWHHIASVRNGNFLKLFLDGALVGQADFSGSVYNSSSFLLISSCDYPNFNNKWTGYLEKIRITKGVARYTEDFSSTFNKSYISLTDQRWGYVWETPSAVTFDLENYKSGTSSLKFDGQTCLALPSNLNTLPHPFNWTLSSDFTIEMWIRNSGSSLYYPTVLTSGTSTSWSTDSFVFWCGMWYEKGIIRIGQYGDTEVVSRSFFNLDEWKHVALVKEYGVLNLYVDGYLECGYVFNDFLYLGSSAGAEPYLGGNNWDAENSYFKGNIDGFRITESARYLPPVSNVQCYTVPTSANPDAVSSDPYWNNVLYLQKFDYMGGPYQNLSDHLYRIDLRYQAKIVDTDFMFGSGSLFMQQNPDCVVLRAYTKDLNLGTSDFAIEMWIKFEGSSTSWRYLLRNNFWGVNAWTLEWNHSSALNKFSFFVYNHSTSSPVVTSDTFTTHNTWIHLAVTRASNSFRIFINGIQSGATGASSANLENGASSSLIIGALGTSPSSGGNFSGWLDSLRITRGVARYTSNFTAPSEAFPSPVSDDPLYGAVVSSLHFEGADNSTTITDSRGLITWTAAGTAKIKTAQKKFGSSSIYFDGASSGYIVSNINQYVNLFSSSFTMEAWIYLDPSFSSDGTIFCITDGTGVGYWGINYKSILKIGASRNVVFALSTGYNTSNYLSGNIFVPLSTWVHVAASYDTYTRRRMIFVNGILDKMDFIHSNFYEDETCRVTIGRLDPLDTVSIWAFKGYIDEARITKTQQQAPRYTIPRVFVPSDSLEIGPVSENDLDVSSFSNLKYSEYKQSFSLDPQKLLNDQSFSRKDRLTRFYKKGIQNYFSDDVLSSRSPIKKISGHVYYTHVPSRKRVYLYDKNTKQLIDDTWSDPETGYYEFLTEADLKYYILAFDESGQANIVAEDDVSPV